MRNTRGLALGNAVSAAKLRAMTHCKRGHPLSGDNLYIQVQRGFNLRVCRICRKKAKDEFEARRHEQRDRAKIAARQEAAFRRALKVAPRPYRVGMVW